MLSCKLNLLHWHYALATFNFTLHSFVIGMGLTKNSLSVNLSNLVTRVSEWKIYHYLFCQTQRLCGVSKKLWVITQNYKLRFKIITGMLNDLISATRNDQIDHWNLQNPKKLNTDVYLLNTEIVYLRILNVGPLSLHV